jgi:hypothetical protein
MTMGGLRRLSRIHLTLSAGVNGMWNKWADQLDLPRRRAKFDEVTARRRSDHIDQTLDIRSAEKRD